MVWIGFPKAEKIPFFPDILIRNGVVGDMNGQVQLFLFCSFHEDITHISIKIVKQSKSLNILTINSKYN